MSTPSTTSTSLLSTTSSLLSSTSTLLSSTSTYSGVTPNDDRCGLYNKNKTSDNYLHVPNYGGIPVNLATNLIGLSILIVLFVVVRKSAWKMVNKLVKKDNGVDRWFHVFYSFTANIGDQILQRKDKVGVVESRETDFVLRTETETDEQQQQQQPHQQLQVAIVENDETDQVNSPSGDHATNGDAVGSHDVTHPAADESTSSAEAGSTADEDQPQLRRSQADLERRRERISRTLSITDEMSFGQWLASIFTMSDEDIHDRCGNDALQYLRFQRHVILYLMIITVISVSVILPINFQGDLQGDNTSFEHTTLVNLEASSDMLLVHVCLAFIYFPLAILVMRRFSIGLHFQKVSLEISRTLMLDQVPRAACKNVEDFRKHFEEAFPETSIKDIRFAYNVNKLQTIHLSLVEARLSLDYCRRSEQLGQPAFNLYPVNCSRCCSCFCCCCVNKLNAMEFYSDEVTRLTREFEKEKETALATPLGIVFVTFKSVNMAKDVYDAHRRSIFECSFQPPTSSMSSFLKPENWKVTFAPTPDDLYWENLSVSRRYLTSKKVIINIALFLVTFFLTTPEYIVSQTNSILPTITDGLKMPSWMVEFLPTLMLWSFTALLPLLVSYSDRWLGHWTRSKENHSIMMKTFWYLLFMVILLPTLGFTTASASIQFFFGAKNETFRWECIFLPDSGAFFVNYVITAALIGAGLELIRFPELFWYTLQICWSRSRAESAAIQTAIKYEFRFGEQYARIMLLFCMTIMFSVSCPLITPFGTLYFIMKHYVDRHNLLYVNKPSKINKKMHATAIGFVILSTVFLQFLLTVFVVLRSGSITDLDLKSKLAIGFFLVSVNIYLAQIWSDTCQKFSPIEYIECTYLREDTSDSAAPTVYLPDILKDDSDRTSGSGSRRRHGGTGRGSYKAKMDSSNKRRYYLSFQS